MSKCEHGLRAKDRCLVCISPKHGEPPKSIRISAIHLLAIGDKAIVRFECGGNWYHAISETMDGPFSHIIEVGGMLTAIEACNSAGSEGSA